MLLLLANFGVEGCPEPNSAQMSKETLAEMFGNDALAGEPLHE